MISAVIIAKNEETHIAEAIKSVLWCDEVIIIDDDSTDMTASFAEKLGAKVFHHHLTDFATQRNFALEKAKGDWILFIDADECVSDKLKNEIMQATSTDNTVKGYFLKRQDIIWGKELIHGETAQIRLLRLARRNAGRWRGNVHETWDINGKTSELSHPLLHYPHPSITEFLAKINLYSDIRAKELYEQGVKTNALLVILYPKAKFALNYIIKLGFLDGTPGLVHALMMSMHSFLVRGKLWLLWQKKSSS